MCSRFLVFCLRSNQVLSVNLVQTCRPCKTQRSDLCGEIWHPLFDVVIRTLSKRFFKVKMFTPGKWHKKLRMGYAFIGSTLAKKHDAVFNLSLIQYMYKTLYCIAWTYKSRYKQNAWIIILFAKRKKIKEYFKSERKLDDTQT